MGHWFRIRHQFLSYTSGFREKWPQISENAPFRPSLGPCPGSIGCPRIFLKYGIHRQTSILKYRPQITHLKNRFFASFAIISAICHISIVIRLSNYNGNTTYSRNYVKWSKKRIFRWVLYSLCLRIDVRRCMPCFRAPKRVEKVTFLNFEVTVLEILTCRTKMDAGFGISGPKLVKTNHQTFCSI